MVRFPWVKTRFNPRQGQSAEARQSYLGERGQIVIEYVLLLLVVVSIASVLVRTMVDRTPDNEGFIIKGWVQLIKDIANDPADEVPPP